MAKAEGGQLGSPELNPDTKVTAPETLERAIQKIEGPACATFEPGGPAIEDVGDLIADLERGFAALAAAK